MTHADTLLRRVTVTIGPEFAGLAARSAGMGRAIAYIMTNENPDTMSAAELLSEMRELAAMQCNAERCDVRVPPPGDTKALQYRADRMSELFQALDRRFIVGTPFR